MAESPSYHKFDEIKVNSESEMPPIQTSLHKLPSPSENLTGKDHVEDIQAVQNGLLHEADNKLLSSTHLVFFKIADYVDFNALFCRRFKKSNALVIFRNVESFFDVLIATAILCSQIIIMSNFFAETRLTCGDEHRIKNLWMGGILCSLYAACVATESCLKGLPYEIVGTTPESANRLINAIQEMKRKTTDSVHNDLESLADIQRSDSYDPPSAADTANTANYLNQLFNLQSISKYSTLAVSLLYLYSIAFVLQFMNLLLVLVVATIMGNATSFTDLATKFISIELITHVHEIVPRVLRMKDKSPLHYNQSGIDLEQTLESKGLLPYGQVIKEDKANGIRGYHRNSAKFHKHCIFWIYFGIIYGIFLGTLFLCKTSKHILNN